jgi:hypothetical protein
MPPWFNSVFPEPGAHPAQLALRLVLAFLLGWTVAGIYQRTNGGEVAPSFRATLVLLTILIAAVTQVIGDNVARAFSLVGALSIVRFRTIVQDTRDTAFVIFAVTVGMAVGAGNMWVAGLSLVVVGVAAAVVARQKPALVTSGDFELTVCVPLGYQAGELLAPVFERHVARSTVSAISTANRGASLETCYTVRLRPGASPAALVDELNGLEGIQSVQLRRRET